MTSPGASAGTNEYGVRSRGQKPLVRPGWPSRLRPTGSWHELQNRWLSGTTGSVSTALVGSRSGTGGIATRFAPSRPRRLLRDVVPRDDVVRSPADPVGADNDDIAPVGRSAPTVARSSRASDLASGLGSDLASDLGS